MFAEDITEDFSDITFTGFYTISGYLRNLRGRLLSSEKFSEVFTLWVFALKPFPVVPHTFLPWMSVESRGLHSMPPKVSAVICKLFQKYLSSRL